MLELVFEDGDVTHRVPVRNERIPRERAARDRLERYHSLAVIEAVLSDSGSAR
jgi:hypothetical protein